MIDRIEGFENNYIESRSIGGTDAGAIIGVNKYKTIQDVWDRLTGRARPVPDNAFMERGRVMEPVIAQIYERATNRNVAPAERLFHGEHPFLHASIDRRITSGLPVDMHGPGVLEIKCLGAWTFKQTKDEGIDPSYYAQLQHYLFVTGFRWGSFAVFNADLWELHTIDVMRDEPFIADMVDKCVRFWNDHVETGVRPELLPEPSPFLPANVGGEAVILNTPAIQSAMRDLAKAREHLALAKRGAELAEEVVKELVGDNTVVVIPGAGKVTYKYEDRTSFDRDMLAIDHPEIDLSRYMKRSTSRVFRPTFRG